MITNNNLATLSNMHDSIQPQPTTLRDQIIIQDISTPLSSILITQQEHFDAHRSRLQAHIDSLTLKDAINTTSTKVSETNKIMNQNNCLVVFTSLVSIIIACLSLGVSIYSLSNK